MSFLALVFAAQAAALPAPPAVKAPHYLKARDLLERCNHWRAGPDYCYGYVTSVYDTVRAYETWLKLNEMCVPEGTAQSELVETVTDYLRDNPGEMDSQAASIVVVALQRRFRC